MLVDLNVQTKEKTNYSNTNVNVGTTWGKKWRFRTGIGKSYSKEINYTEGTLVINMIDPEKDQLVWKGSNTNVVKEKNLNNEKIKAGIDAILGNFPPNAQ